MDPGERITGTRDEHYNLISVLYHALHGAENCDIYAMDAEAVGRIELSDFFKEAQAMQRQLANEAKELLGIGGAVPGAGGVQPGAAPLQSDIPPETTPGVVTPMTEDVPPRSGDVQQEAQVRADEVGAPAEEIPPTTDVPRTPPDTALPPEEDVVVEPMERPMGDVPPQEADIPGEAPVPPDTPRAGDVPRTEEVPPPPSEPPPPAEEPPETERSTGASREYFSDIIRESDRRSRGEI